MGALKVGSPFGLEKKYIDAIDWSLAIKRISNDMRSDFIFAPHLNYILRLKKDSLIELVKSELSAGKYIPGLPVTIEVPKSSRIKISVQPPRSGPNYSRPGSILMPKDRLVYQILSDEAAEIIAKKTDKNRSFSHVLDIDNPERMFKPTRVCWDAFQKDMRKKTSGTRIKYVLKIDIANFFGSINQHTLVNVLADAGLRKPYVDRLENILTSFSGDRSSRGIIQGIFPSDILGNFYLEPLDRFLDDKGVPSARYVDDVYIFVKSVNEAEALVRALIPELRSYDLSLNEAKSAIIPKKMLVVEEPDLEDLFRTAIDEVAQQLDRESFDVGYGFQMSWEDEDEEEDEDDEDSDDSDVGESEEEFLKIEATKKLFDGINNYPGHEESIERFCLPIFTQASSDYAVHHVLNSFDDRPSMSQLYCSYLSRFIDDEDVYEFLCGAIQNSNRYEWQRMWILASLLQRETVEDSIVREVHKIFSDGGCHETVRAVAAIFIGRFGDATRRKSLVSSYGSVSVYIQAAIFYISRKWPSVEKNNAKSLWSNSNELNKLIKD